MKAEQISDDLADTLRTAQSRFFKTRRSLVELDDDHDVCEKSTLVFGGLVKTCRQGSKGTVVFLMLADGSNTNPVQLVIDATVPNFAEIKKLTTGASVAGRGLIVQSVGSRQKWEILIQKNSNSDENSSMTELEMLSMDETRLGLHIFGECDATTYPLAKKTHTKEHLRMNQHLRCRSTFFQCVMRIRSCLSMAVHEFYHKNGFYYIHSPIITTADAEGGADMFSVLAEKELTHYIKGRNADKVPHFFKKKTFLTTSGQISAETLACALSKVYTFGPTFRAETSHTSKHLSEFWMIEPEMAFADLPIIIETAYSTVQYALSKVLGCCKAEVDCLSNDAECQYDLAAQITMLASQPLEMVHYEKAIALLIDYFKSDEGKSTIPENEDVESIAFGSDLSSFMEKTLTDKIFTNKAVAVTHWPMEIKAFYMKQSKDPRCCESVDILFPGVGELVGGSAREDDLAALTQTLKKREMDMSLYDEYLDTRRYGTVPHAGFGIGFERLVMLATGINNIRDTIPYPRAPGVIFG